VSAPNPFEARFDDSGVPRVFRRDYSLFDEAAGLTEAVAREQIAADPSVSLDQLAEQAAEAARKRGLTEALAKIAVKVGMAAALEGTTLTATSDFPADLRAQLDEIGAEHTHSQLIDDVREIAYLTACDIERGRLPGSVAEHYQTEVARAIRRGLRVTEARETVAAGFHDAFESEGQR